MGDESFVCRICLGEHDSDLIQPCLCSGSVRFVHRACLDTWRATKQAGAFSSCGTCKFKYKIVEKNPDIGLWELLWYRLKVGRDLCAIACLLFLAIALCAYGAAELSRYTNITSLIGFDSGLHILSRHEVHELDPSAATPGSERDSITDSADDSSSNPGNIQVLRTLLPAPHSPDCPLYIWWGWGLLLFSVTLGIVSIIAWFNNLFPDDFEVQRPCPGWSVSAW